VKNGRVAKFSYEKGYGFVAPMKAAQTAISGFVTYVITGKASSGLISARETRAVL